MNFIFVQGRTGFSCDYKLLIYEDIYRFDRADYGHVAVKNI